MNWVPISGKSTKRSGKQSGVSMAKDLIQLDQKTQMLPNAAVRKISLAVGEIY